MRFQNLGIVVLILQLVFCQSAKILYVMPSTSRSHYIGMKALALELASRGHEVYAITPHKEDKHPPNYHQLMISNVSFWTKLFDVQPRVFEMMDVSFEAYQMLLYKSGLMVNELVFESADVQNFMKQNHKIDLGPVPISAKRLVLATDGKILTDSLWPKCQNSTVRSIKRVVLRYRNRALVVTEIFFNEGLYMFAHKYQAPLVLVTTVGNSLKGNHYMGNPLQLSILFHEYGTANYPLSFLGRLYNLYLCAFDLFMLKFYYFPLQQESALQYFKDLPQPVPSLEDIASDAALVLINSHISIDTPGAYLPNIIEVGGLHIKESNESLPEDLQTILDNSKNGVVYLSFGSNVQISEMDEDKLDAFLKVFGELKQTVLMKWEEDAPIKNVPKNVLLRKWFPQNSVIAHPNVKLFIGHGGLLSLQETISAGVPILGVPVYGDQYLNILDTMQKGHGEILYYKDINEYTVRTKINKILNDKSYIETARKIADRFKDRPMKPLETAVWWVEYVIRHKGAEFMKPPKMSYFAYKNLDVYAFLVGVLALIVYVILKIVGIVRKAFSSKKVSKKQKKN